METAPITILVVDDEPSVRRGLRMRLSLEHDMEVVGEAEHGAAAIEQVRALCPDIVLMDVQMPVMDGIAATERLCEPCDDLPPCAVVVLSMLDDDGIRARARKAGASAFVSKREASEALPEAIRAAAASQRNGAQA